VLAERGFSLDMMELTRRAGVGSGTVYRYFGSKEGMIRTVVDELVTKTRQELREIARTPGDARTDVKRTMRVGFTRVREYGQLTIVLVAGTQPPQYRDLLERKELEEFFAQLLHRGVAQGHFRADLDIDYAVGVWFAVVAPEALGRLLSRRSVDEVASSTTAFFLAGVSR
jgi:AcrR family transcriptional regulator